MKEEIFKVGDRVYDFQYGWGVVIEDEYNNWCLNVMQDSGRTTVYTGLTPNTLSFTEYTLQGFSQERPIELPEVGELCLVRKTTISEWSVDKFGEFINGKDFPFRSVDGTNWKEFKRIKILD